MVGNQGVVQLWNGVEGLDVVPGVDPALLNTFRKISGLSVCVV